VAQLIPRRPVATLPTEVARVYQALRRLPDSWRAWYHMTPWDDEEAPDFLLLDDQGHALLLQVSRATPQLARESPQLQLLGLEVEQAVPGEREQQILDAFGAHLERQGVPAGAVAAAVIFPNLDRRDLAVVEGAGIVPAYPWLSRDWLEGRGASAWAAVLSTAAIDEDSLHLLRQEFTQEAVIPKAFVPREIRPRDTSARLETYLLDYAQEDILKTDLDLPVAGQALSRDLRVQLINGITGSGKTLILLYRLRLLHAMFPAKRFLVLTHNQALIREMQARFALLNEARDERIRWSTFQGLCRTMWYPDSSRWTRPLSIRERERLIHAVWKDCLAQSGVSERMFAQELGWIKDLGLAHREEYLDADRTGRGFRLSGEQREGMFAAVREYQIRLRHQRRLDWWDVPRRLWHWIERGSVEPEPYDVIMVDEAQFFAPVWFRIVQRMVLPELGYLFLAADPTQGFLRRGESWKSVAGLEVRGRSYHLQRSYRTTRAILRFAWSFYRQRLPDDDVEALRPRWTGMRKGRVPVLARFDSPQDERARIVNEVVQAVGTGVPLRHVLVLHASWRGADALRAALNQRLGEGAAADPRDTVPGAYVRVTTINAGTGLESPIVFVAGIHEMLEAEAGLLLTAEDRDSLVREHTRKLYMAFTRAGQRLVVSYVGEVLPPCLQDLADGGLVEV
jgi:hypothetical protein